MTGGTRRTVIDPFEAARARAAGADATDYTVTMRRPVPLEDAADVDVATEEATILNREAAGFGRRIATALRWNVGPTAEALDELDQARIARATNRKLARAARIYSDAQNIEATTPDVPAEPTAAQIALKAAREALREAELNLEAAKIDNNARDIDVTAAHFRHAMPEVPTEPSEADVALKESKENLLAEQSYRQALRNDRKARRQKWFREKSDGLIGWYTKIRRRNRDEE